MREKLKVRDQDSKAYLNRFERLLMQLTRHELADHAQFIGDSSFQLNSRPFPDAPPDIPLGLYELPRRSGEAYLYRLNHSLAAAVVSRAKRRELPEAEIQFAYGEHAGKITLLEPLIGKRGWLTLCLFSVESLDQGEDHWIFGAATDDGEGLEEEVASRLLTLPGRVVSQQSSGSASPTVIASLIRERQGKIQRSISERNARFFEAEADKLDGWADDLKLGLERDIKELDRQVKEARRAATTALTLEEKLDGQKQIRALEAQRNDKRRSLFDAQDTVDKQREELIAKIEGKLQQRTETVQLFTIRWQLA